MPAASKVVACLLATIAVGGCASSTTRALDESSGSSSASGHGSLTDHEFNVAVAVARAEVYKYAATVTSATATVGEGTETDPNAGPPCTSGTLLHIKLIGTFNQIVVGGGSSAGGSSAAGPIAGGSSAAAPIAGGPTNGNNYSVSAVLITADPESGKACVISVRTGPTTPDPGATLLFTS